MFIAFRIAGIVSALCLMATAQSVGAQTTGGKDSGVRAAIEAANQRTFIAGAQKGDAALIASAYTDDAIAYPANSEPVKGRAALQALWKSVLDSGINAIELNTMEVESSGDLAYETGNYVMKSKAGTVADRGQYVVIWKRIKGEWRLHRDIWTTSMPVKK